MGYTHFDKVSGKNGLAVGAKGSEVVVANASGNLHQAGTQITATADELNLNDLSMIGALVKIKKVTIAAPGNGDETESGFTLPDTAVVLDVFLNVTTAEATGTTKTIDVGTDSTDSGDADGYLKGINVSATGLKKGTLVSTGQTLGALLYADEDGSGGLVREPDVASGGKKVTFTMGSADCADFEGDLYILYIELA